MTTFQILNESSVVDSFGLPPLAVVLQKALVEDFMPAWNPGGPVQVLALGDANPLATRIRLIDQELAAGAGGFHSAPGGTAEIVIQVPEVAAGQLSAVISHEIFETIADWLGILMVQGPWVPPVWYEVCDPVEDQSYDVLGMPISNFILPHWFVAGSSGPFDHLGKLQAPFELSSGGYVGLADGTVNWGSERADRTLRAWRRGGRRSAASRHF